MLVAGQGLGKDFGIDRPTDLIAPQGTSRRADHFSGGADRPADRPGRAVQTRRDRWRAHAANLGRRACADAGRRTADTHGWSTDARRRPANAHWWASNAHWRAADESAMHLGRGGRLHQGEDRKDG